MERVGDIVRMEDYCPSCQSKYSIEVYDVYNRPLGLTRLLNRNLLRELDNKRLSYMKCKKCGKDFRINYVNGNLQPLNSDINYDYQMFNDNFENRKDTLFGKHIFHSGD